MVTQLDPEDRRSLVAYRRAALQVRQASIIASGATIGFSGSVSPTGEVTTSFRLLSEEPFRSLAASIRLVYMQKEPANFQWICNILFKKGDADVCEIVKDCRLRYTRTLEGKTFQFNLHGEFEGTTVGPREVFEAWLYGLVFHQDPEQTKVAEELAKYQGGFAFPFAVNAVALQLAGVILDLDDVIARFLGEAPMPRISGESQSDAEPSTPDASE